MNNAMREAWWDVRIAREFARSGGMMPSFKIHKTHPHGSGWQRFEGTREEAEAAAEALIGKPASWNFNNRPPTPNMDDCYTEAWVEEE